MYGSKCCKWCKIFWHFKVQQYLLFHFLCFIFCIRIVHCLCSFLSLAQNNTNDNECQILSHDCELTKNYYDLEYG
ncbi:hypothetical protein GDO81_010063 [Engystomops pustulosus]|uniref:Uncharacterized protein n=1 Tax=Engystomops pustulosus TaxID=76066 RepID=A0AAV7BXT1_ENGPU|nr:hypothetical protein GDO81_010063 [Engystomops pustulosus]